MRKRFVLALAFLLAIGMQRTWAVVPAPSPDENPEGNTGALKSQVQTGGSYDAHSGNGTRIVGDLTVPGALGAYGLDFTRYWNSVHNDDDNPYAEWPMDFGNSGWSHSWKWTARESHELTQLDDMGGPQGRQIYTTAITITFPDGHASKFKITRSNMPVWPSTWVDPRYGPPYLPDHSEINWGSAGAGAHDYLDDMAVDGSSFWLHRADGGSVYFTGAPVPGGPPVDYQAVQVFDPHGLRTDLHYDHGYLWKVEQEGGRWLEITWGTLATWAAPVITRVATGGYAAGQSVLYKYARFPNSAGGSYVLAKVSYPNEPAPGLSASALYFYGTCMGNQTEPCNSSAMATPLLKYAVDPHYAGAMTAIRYNYRGVACDDTPPLPFNPDYFRASELALAAEQSGETGQTVSSLAIDCGSGTRMETNGLGAWRMFCFGRSAGTDPGGLGYHCLGYQLAKLTDFTDQFPLPSSLPSDLQNYLTGHPRQIWDGRRLKTESFYLDASGSPSEVRYADGSNSIYDRLDETGSAGRAPSRVHNPNSHWLFKKKDEENRWTRYIRDARRRVTRIEYPDNSSESFVYDGDNNNLNGLNQVTSHILPSGAVETYQYDPVTHRLMVEYNSIDGWDARKEYTYDALERVETMTDGRARINYAPFTAKMTYNGRHKVTSVEYASTAGSQHPTVRYEYDLLGNCTAITDELGHRSVFTYDPYRRCTSYTEPLNAPGWNGGANVASRTWNWVYDRVRPNGTTVPPSAHTSSKWRLQIEPSFNAAGDRRATARDYDYNDSLNFEFTGIIVPAQGPWIYDMGAMHRYAYDANGQKRSYIDPKNRETTYDYDNRNRLWKTNETINTLPRTTETLYDRTGNKTFVRFPDQKTQQWLYFDAFGQPRLFIDERNNPTDLTYWPWGPMKKLATVTTHRLRDGGGMEDQLTRFYYDGMGRPQSTYFPDNSYEYAGYEFGQVKVWETRLRQTKRLEYDARGRETLHRWDNNAASWVGRQWDAANRLTGISNAFSAIDYGYDDAGQAKWEGNDIKGSGGRVQTAYCRYPSGEVSRVTYPNGSTTVTRNYTPRGQLERVDWGTGNTSYVYLPDGKVDQQDYGNGVRTKYEYNGRGMIQSMRHKKNLTGPDLASREYWRDDRDRITAWKRGTVNSENSMENGRGDRYGYDEEGQLTAASYRAENPEINATNPSRIDSFQYDALGNRKGSNYVASRGALDFTRKDNGLNQYSGWWPYCFIKYDDDLSGWGTPGTANGVLMQDGWITGSYNALNQPVGMMSPAYAGTGNWVWFGHDPLGRCVKRWVGPASAAYPRYNPATYFYYDGWNLIQEGGSASSATRLYVHGGRVDEMVAQITTGNNWQRYFQYDGRGHCLLQTDALGDIVEQYDYDAFGFPYFYDRWGNDTGSSAWGNRFLFTGREWLSDLRTYDYRNRMYQPELGRFLQPDPQQFAAGDYNLYRYCHNDPINHSDPTGEVALPGAVIGGISGVATEIGFQALANYAEGKPLFSDLNYTSIASSGLIGAGTGAIGVGLVTQGKRAITLTRQVQHIRQVLKAREAAAAAGKVRNLEKTIRMQQQLAETAKKAALAAAAGATGPVLKAGVKQLQHEKKKEENQ